MTHIHIIPNGRHFSLRAGRFLSVVGYQTAEAAGLDVVTRDGTGYGLSGCLDHLTEPQARELGAQLDAWLELVGAFERPGSVRKPTKAMQATMQKYRSATGDAPATTPIRSLPRTVDEATFWKRVEASGVAEGSRFVK